MKILVTGGLGYIGWAVTRSLRQAGHDVDVLSRQSNATPPAGARLVRADLTDADALTEVVTAGRYDGVCHLAALTRGRDSFADPLGYWHVNVGGTLNLIRAIAAARPPTPTRFVLASTNIVYGSQREGALSEDLPPRPESPYGASKAAAERLVSDVAATGAITAVILRVFNASGAVDRRPDRDPTRIIPAIMRVARGELPVLAVNGDGTVRRDFTHVADVATAFRLALETDRPDTTVYNVGTGRGTSVADLITAAEAITGRPIPIERRPPKPEPHTSIADPTRIQTDLGWRPENSDLTTILGSAWDAANSPNVG
jgi:UDP-glucose 4-epimerase